MGGAGDDEGNVIVRARPSGSGTDRSAIGAGVAVFLSGEVATGNGQTVTFRPFDVRVLGNQIGVGAGGAALGNAGPGVDIVGSRGVTVGRWGDPGAGNLIAHNAGAGVRVSQYDLGSGRTARSDRNPIEGNYLFDNGGLGIDLVAPTREPASGWNAADRDDADDGPNTLLNYPSIDATEIGSDTARLRVTLYGARDTDLHVRLYVSAERDPSGSGEGASPLQDVTVGGQPLDVLRTDRLGRRVVTTDPVSLAPGQFVSGTVTDAAGNTSEFGYAEEIRETAVEVQVTNGSAGMAPFGYTVDVWLDGPAGRIDLTSGLGFGVPSGRRQIPPGTYTAHGMIVPTNQSLSVSQERLVVAEGESRHVDLFVIGNPRLPSGGGTFVPTPGGTLGVGLQPDRGSGTRRKPPLPAEAPCAGRHHRRPDVRRERRERRARRSRSSCVARGRCSPEPCFGDYSEFASVPDGPADIEVRRASTAPCSSSPTSTSPATAATACRS